MSTGVTKQIKLVTKRANYVTKCATKHVNHVTKCAKCVTNSVNCVTWHIHLMRFSEKGGEGGATGQVWARQHVVAHNVDLFGHSFYVALLCYRAFVKQRSDLSSETTKSGRRRQWHNGLNWVKMGSKWAVLSCLSTTNGSASFLENTFLTHL